MSENIKNFIELTEENVVETGENSESLRQGFAKELRTPYGGSFTKKLRRIAGAFALAGVTAFAPEARTPELTDEYIEASAHEFVEDIKKEGKEAIYRKILEALDTKGGVPISGEGPEKLFKAFPEHLQSEATRQARLAEQGEEPYFSKPEVIFGKDFIAKNPEKAAEYMKKIKDVMQATAMIYTPTGAGSGTFINFEGQKLLLTNAHVVQMNENEIIFTTSTGKMAMARAQFLDEKSDLALISTANKAGEEALSEINAMDLLEESTPAPKEKLVSVGNAFSFPFEVLISEYGWDQFIHLQNNNTMRALMHTPDARFRKLASFYRRGFSGEQFDKGIALPGMSGSPLVPLEQKGRAKLAGLNSLLKVNVKGDYHSGAVPADTIKAFLESYKTAMAHGFSQKKY